MSEKSIKAVENHSAGYNCAQAVVSVFEESTSDLIKATSSFGGGIVGQRQVCGAVSGMCMMVGIKNGYDTPERGEIKQSHKETIANICNEFQEKAGSITCGELLRLEGFSQIPSDKNLSCSELVKLGVELAEKYTKCKTPETI